MDFSSIPKLGLQKRTYRNYFLYWVGILPIDCYALGGGLKNALAVVFRAVVTAELIHKFMEVYLDDWTVFYLLK